MAFFFSSDHHFGHINIIKHCHRPFVDVEHMNIELVRRWNEKVGSGDHVFYLGDFSLRMNTMLEFLPQLNGHIHFIPGNHDQFHPMHKSSKGRVEKIQATSTPEALRRVFPLQHTVNFQHTPVLMCHFPYSNNQEDQRYPEWRPQFDFESDKWLLHGHRHSSPEKRLDRELRTIDVGVDAWDYAPVNWIDLFDLMFPVKVTLDGVDLSNV